MRVAHAIDLHELNARAGRREGRVREVGRALAECGLGQRRFDAPPVSSGRRIAGDDVAAGFDERTGNAVRAERTQTFLQDVALGNAAQVEAHTRPFETDRSARGVEADAPPADERTSRVNRFALGHPARFACLAPHGNQRTNRRVERAIARARNGDCAVEYGEEFRADSCPFAGMSFQPSQLAVRTVVAHHLVQRRHARESRLGSGANGPIVGGVHDDADGKTHVDFSELVGPR